MPFDLPPLPPEPMAVPSGLQVVMPARLPVECFVAASRDYQIPVLVMVAMVKHESGGRSVVRVNEDGSRDVGVSQHNSRGWGKFFRERFGISEAVMLNDPCQSIRAQGYALRYEMRHPRCVNLNWSDAVWCAVERYHAPNNPTNASIYLGKVQSAYRTIVSTGRFE